MTISYAGNFAKLLLRWKGSLWKAVWLEALVFLTAYYIINSSYRLWMTGITKSNFEALVLSVDQFVKGFPITFLLGFYVSAVVKRWWEQFQFVGWPDDTLSYVCSLLPGSDAETIQKRRTIARWLVLTAALAWRDVSIIVRKRFPTLRHLIMAGLMTEDELAIYDQIVTPAAKWFLPLHWVQRAVESEIRDRHAPAPITAGFLTQLNHYRNGFRSLYCYDWVCIPLVYTQVAALATYGYFGFCLIGRQIIDPNLTMDCKCSWNSALIDIYFPIYTMLEFLFYVGWFKVGQYLMRPFEQDDDDLELNYFLDRHLQVAMAYCRNSNISTYTVTLSTSYKLERS